MPLCAASFKRFAGYYRKVLHKVVIVIMITNINFLFKILVP